MAVMLRTLGVPSRNVTGFVGGEWNAYGRYYVLRNGDAHSWVEAYVGDRWLTFDPTPPIRDAMGPERAPFGGLAALFDALRVEWAQRVVGYDLRSQVRILRGAWGWLRAFRLGSGPSAERGLGAGPRRRDDPFSAPALGAIVIVCGVAFGLVGLVALFLRRRARAEAAEPEAARLLRALERAMARLGRTRAPAETPEAWARALVRDGGPHAELVREVMAVYVDARYRGRAIAPARMDALFRGVRRIPRSGAQPMKK
jgi:hypothetical protein